jgi:hypothetical protein
MTMRAKSLIAASLALLASCQSPLRADAAEVPAQYRGLWCDRDDGSYYRCRKATSEGYMDIGRNRIKVDEETSCRIATVKPTAKGHRLTLTPDCSAVEPPKYIDLRLDARGGVVVDHIR